MHSKWEWLRELTKNILNSSITKWVFLGFLFSYFLFFILPIFLTGSKMQFPEYIQEGSTFGIDLKQTLSYSYSLFVAKQTPYVGGNSFPPLVSVLFGPWLLIKFSRAYKIFTLFNVFCFILVTLIFPLKLCRNKNVLSLLLVIFTTGLFSYGLQFELERGQFDLIAISICFLGIWIFHHHSRFRLLAYFLFIISVQLKVYPFIFIVMFIDDWRDWKRNFIRLSLLSIINFAMFFILGLKIFVDFLNGITAQAQRPYLWEGNHSIHSFLYYASQNIPGLSWVNQNSGLMEFVLLAITLACIFLITLQIFRKKLSGINSYLLLACTIGSLIIPTASHDYTLSFLVAPVAIFLINVDFSANQDRPLFQLIFIILIVIFSIAYSSTLFSYVNKTLIFRDNFPALITMLLVTTFLSFMDKAFVEKKLPK